MAHSVSLNPCHRNHLSEVAEGEERAGAGSFVSRSYKARSEREGRFVVCAARKGRVPSPPGSTLI